MRRALRVEDSASGLLGGVCNDTAVDALACATIAFANPNILNSRDVIGNTSNGDGALRPHIRAFSLVESLVRERVLFFGSVACTPVGCARGSGVRVVCETVGEKI